MEPKTVPPNIAGSQDHVAIQLIAHIAITLWLDLKHRFGDNFAEKV